MYCIVLYAIVSAHSSATLFHQFLSDLTLHQCTYVCVCFSVCLYVRVPGPRTAAGLTLNGARAHHVTQHRDAERVTAAVTWCRVTPRHQPGVTGGGDPGVTETSGVRDSEPETSSPPTGRVRKTASQAVNRAAGRGFSHNKSGSVDEVLLLGNSEELHNKIQLLKCLVK